MKGRDSTLQADFALTLDALQMLFELGNQWINQPKIAGMILKCVKKLLRLSFKLNSQNSISALVVQTL